MQFFEHQDQARGRTTLLVVLFSLAVLALGFGAAIGLHLILSFPRSPDNPPGPQHWSLVATAAIGTWGIIALGSFYRMAQLKSGGKTVAETLGGTLIHPSTTDPLERRAIHVVEEMAIASSLPVPPVYVLQREKGINAFAAGWSPDDAVIGLTRGTLEGLNRDQLQGVIAHEFSHVLNRDCALNMRLMGVLHGIIVISVLGRTVMRWSARSRHTSTRREGGIVQIFVLGAGIWLFGSIGVLIARFIQAAVSQQREFLADASAVQFTRNPGGIAGALATIASSTSRLESPRGLETSHMLIGEPGKASFLSVLSSHPPLFERISRILPRWDGDFLALATPPGGESAHFEAARRQQLEADFIPGLELLLDPVAPLVATNEDASRASLAGHSLSHAQRILAELPQKLRTAAEAPFSCRAVVLCLVASQDQESRAKSAPLESSAGLEILSQVRTVRADVGLCEETERLYSEVTGLSAAAQLPLFDIALSTLASLSAKQREHFDGQLRELSELLFARSYGAYCLLAVAQRHLGSPVPQDVARPMLIKSAIETILSILAHEGHESSEDALAAFRAGTATLGKRGEHLALLEPARLDVRSLHAALSILLRLPASTRADILNGAETIAQNDGVVRPSEAALLRTLALSLHLAVPPQVATVGP